MLFDRKRIGMFWSSWQKMGSMPSLQAFFPVITSRIYWSSARLDRLTKIHACLLALSLIVMSSKGMLMRKFMSWGHSHIHNLHARPCLIPYLVQACLEQYIWFFSNHCFRTATKTSRVEREELGIMRAGHYNHLVHNRINNAMQY